MAIIALSPVNIEQVTDASQLARWGMGNFLSPALGNYSSPTVQVSQPIYRGYISGNYVYSTGTPPGGGAINIVVVGYTVV
jgi:hypothetical protein